MLLTNCNQNQEKSDMKILYLHHSTGGVIWEGASSLFKNGSLPELFRKYNKANQKDYIIEERAFPKSSPYGWKNYPFDYYNIWVKNAGEKPFMEEPTLEILTKEFQVIIFKHCFPVSNIQAELDSADINSEVQTINNYKLQYNALRDKLHEFPEIKFILFTGAAQVRSNITEEEAKRASEFFSWVKEDWDIFGDNIFLWDLYALQTEGDLYFKNEYAVSASDSHPNRKFASKVVRLLFNRIIDVIEQNGNNTHLSGEMKQK
jgi:hypothetical protein